MLISSRVSKIFLCNVSEISIVSLFRSFSCIISSNLPLVDVEVLTKDKVILEKSISSPEERDYKEFLHKIYCLIIFSV